MASFGLPARRSRSPFSLAILPGCFLRAFASLLSLALAGDEGNGATEAGLLGGSGGSGLFDRSNTDDPENDREDLSVLGVPGVADG